MVHWDYAYASWFAWVWFCALCFVLGMYTVELPSKDDFDRPY